MEVWKTIRGFENYKISNYGNVKSLERMSFIGRKVKERILKQNTGLDGYSQVSLFINGKCNTLKIHKLVAISFLNHKPDGYNSVVNHLDFNRLNNNINNLEITTQRKNTNKKHFKSTSRYTGVCWDKSVGKWKSQILINKVKKNIGHFDNEIDAHNAYQKELNN